jgi:hypothetical protein
VFIEKKYILAGKNGEKSDASLSPRSVARRQRVPNTQSVVLLVEAAAVCHVMKHGGFPYKVNLINILFG